MNNFVILDDIKRQSVQFFDEFSYRDEVFFKDLGRLDEILEKGWKKQLHAIFYIPYEFGYPLNFLEDHHCPLYIDWFSMRKVWSEKQFYQFINEYQKKYPNKIRGGFVKGKFDQNFQEYQSKINQIHTDIRAGTYYQMNYTQQWKAEFYGDPLLLYAFLRKQQSASYAVLRFDESNGSLLCLSPELFIDIDGDTITTKPMKGTAKTPENDSDIQQAMLTLQNDEKNKAENTMIVDLLRNDLSKIAKPQSVEVLQAFDVENFGKVLQMTTTIKAKLKEKCSIVDILSAMFPCGSITGMPKRMVMSAIESLESQERGIYTGSLGYLYQKQGRVQGKLNVAIRSLEIADNKAKFGVGGGITIDSQADDEWQECQTKMAFLTQPPEFSIFETLAIKNGDIQYFNAHYQRLKQASEDLYFPELPSMNELKSKIIHQQSGIQDARLKIVHSQKSTDILIYPLQDLQGQQFCMIHTETLETNQSLRRYKTTWRDFYDAAWQFAEEHGAFDALVFNHQQQLLEGGRSNVFVKIKGKWKTPALSLDILNGIMRQKIIADPQLIGALSIEETIITRDDFAHAEEIILTNSLRGIIPVKLKEKP